MILTGIFTVRIKCKLNVRKLHWTDFHLYSYWIHVKYTALCFMFCDEDFDEDFLRDKSSSDVSYVDLCERNLAKQLAYYMYNFHIW